MMREMERLRDLDKQLGKLGGEITGLEKRLGNEAFVAKAPPEVVSVAMEALRKVLPGYRRPPRLRALPATRSPSSTRSSTAAWNSDRPGWRSTASRTNAR